MFNLFKETAFGLDISDFSIEVLELSSRKKVRNFGRVTFREGIIRDGFILNRKKLIEKIKEVVKISKIKTERVILTLPESRVFIHLFQIPKDLKGKELETAVLGEAAKTIPLEQSQIYYDFLEILIEKDGQKPVLYVGVLKDIVDEYINVLDRANLQPIVFDIESAALGRVFLKKEKNSQMIVDIGARTTNISIFDKNLILRYSTTIPLAGNHFTKAIANDLNISIEEAERLKRIHGFSEKSGSLNIKSILEREILLIIEQINKSINYYNDYYKEKIEEIFLVGGSSQLPTIASYFSSKLNIKVSIGKSLIVEKFKTPVLYTAVIGSALRALHKDPEKAGINLLPEKARAKLSLVKKEIKRKKSFKFLTIAYFILSLIVLGMAIYFYILKAPYVEIPQYETLPTQIPNTEIEKIEKTEETKEEIKEEAIEEEIQEEIITKIIIKSTETGWLNVRGGPSTEYPVLIKIYPGESYPLLEESNNWYKIELENGAYGWIFSKYALKVEVKKK